MILRATILLFSLCFVLGSLPSCIPEAPPHKTKPESTTGYSPDNPSESKGNIILGVPDALGVEDTEEQGSTGGATNDAGTTATDDGCNAFNPAYPDC